MGRVKNVWIALQAQADRCPRWAVCLAAALLLFGAGFGCGYYRGSHLYDHGNGANAVREQLNRAEDNQRSITDGLQRAADQSGRITSEIDESRGIVQDIAESAGRSAGQIDQAGSLIDSSQSILERVRQRGKTN